MRFVYFDALITRHRQRTYGFRRASPTVVQLAASSAHASVAATAKRCRVEPPRYRIYIGAVESPSKHRFRQLGQTVGNTRLAVSLIATGRRSWLYFICFAARQLMPAMPAHDDA